MGAVLFALVFDFTIMDWRVFPDLPPVEYTTFEECIVDMGHYNIEFEAMNSAIRAVCERTEKTGI